MKKKHEDTSISLHPLSLRDALKQIARLTALPIETVLGPDR